MSAASLFGNLRKQTTEALERPSVAVAAGIVLLILVANIFSTIRQHRRLAHFKGPFQASLSKWWLIKTVGGGRAYLDFWEVTERYGSIARVGPNDLVTSDPDLMKHILGARTLYRRSDWYDGMRFNPAKNNCLSWRDEDQHLRLRSMMAAGYSGREINDLEVKIDENILRFTSLIDTYLAQGKPFDFGRKAQYFTLDVISDIAFGHPFGFIETDSDVYEYIRTTEDTVAMAMVTTVIPWLVTLLSSPTFKWLMPSEKDKLGFGKVMGVAREYAAERFGPDKKVQRDMLGSFVAHGLSQEEAESEILLQIIAGSDTTATAIRSTILHLVTSPRILAKFREEIAANPYSTRVIPNSTAQEMPYLQAIIKEGLRIFPPVAGLMAKESPPQGDTFKGQYIPGGTRIGYCAWGIFRDTEIFGKDAGEFRPERWIDDSADKIKEMDGVLDLVFSYGKYQCLGRPVALMELNKVFVTLLTQFDLAVCDPTKPWTVSNPGIFNQFDFWVRAHGRTSE